MVFPGMRKRQFHAGKPAGQQEPETEAENPEHPGMGGDEEISGSAAGKSAEELFAEAVRLHQRGVEGDKEAVKEAHKLLARVREMLPENTLVEAYYGSAITLLGRDALDPMERFNKVVKGLKILDGAVSRDPDNIEIRILRANVCYRLPEMYFHRTATAIEDFHYLAACYEEDPGVFSQDYYHRILYDLVAANRNLGRKEEAEAVRQKLLSLVGEEGYKELHDRDENSKVMAMIREEDTGETGADAGVDFQTLRGKSKKELIDEGVKLIGLALEGNREASQKAFSFFSNAVKVDPGDLLFQAYYADSLSLKGRYAADPGEMFTNAIKAMTLFDTLVNRNPDNIQVRLMRAYQSFRLPEAFFRRTATAVADFEYLIQRYERDHSTLPEETYWQILYDLGTGYQRLGLDQEAALARKKLLSLEPGPEYRAMIEQEENNHHSEVDLPSLDNRDALLQEGIRLHDLGVAGNRKAARQALELLERAHREDPGDTLAQGYYGSCLALNARDARDTNTLFGDAIRGLKLLNRAIARDWNNPRLRLLRAYLTYSLPETFFHLTHRALKDFRYLKVAYEKDNSIFPGELYHQILYDLGLAYERIGDGTRSRKVWSKLLRESPDPKYRELLKGKGVNQDELSF